MRKRRTGSVMILAGLLRSKKKRLRFDRNLLDVRYVPGTTGTSRHCYVHPQEIATHTEYNVHDKSYQRPVCAGCVA